VYYAVNWCAHSLFLLFQKRDRVTIIADILKSLNYSKTGRRKTNIMQSANLSYDQLNKYLDLLIRNGYVIVEGQMYKPTSRGLEFLETVENDYLKLRTRV
jgi:predicted transcriptional regulator